MVDVTTRTTIDRPVGEVAAYAADPDRAPEWYANIASVEWETERPLRIGSRVAFVARFLGRTLRYTYEIAELDLPRRLVMRTSQGPFAMETSYTWTALGDTATDMVLRNRGEPRGFSALATPIMARAMRRENVKDLRRLKAICEAAGA